MGKKKLKSKTKMIDEDIENITKTKAKRTIFLKFDKDLKTKVMSEIKNLPKAILTEIPTEDSVKYLIELDSYKSAKEVKEALSKKFEKDIFSVELALNQKKRVNRKIDKEKEIKAKEEREDKKKKGIFEITLPKIILRNLSFKLNEDLLKKEMEKYGAVKLINLPKKEDGKMFGYGFVVFEDIDDAKKAIKEINSRTDKFMGTKFVADWCLPKNLYLKNSSKAQAESNTKQESSGETNENSDAESQNEDEESENEEENEQNQSDASSDDDELPKKKRKLTVNDDEKELDKKSKYNLKRKTGTLDVQEKRTIFIRNLSFDSTEETLQDVFSKFGPIKFVKICYDKDLERPKGTAFIQFESSESATNACLESETLEVDMRTLQIDLAMPREKVNETIDEKKSALHEKKDKRNLALAKEGVIYANSYEAEGISKSDMVKRQNLEAANAQKLKLLHHFVSPTRLSVHNIPIKCTDDELRNIFENSVKEFKSSLKQRAVVKCKIMRDLTRVNSEGVCKSRGYGFVEFSNPQFALKALHATNNNPKLFDNGTRLIVQFSIEDMRALKKQQTRLERSKQKLLQKNKFK